MSLTENKIVYSISLMERPPDLCLEELLMSCWFDHVVPLVRPLTQQLVQP